MWASSQRISELEASEARHDKERESWRQLLRDTDKAREKLEKQLKTKEAQVGHRRQAGERAGGREGGTPQRGARESLQLAVSLARRGGAGWLRGWLAVCAWLHHVIS